MKKNITRAIVVTMLLCGCDSDDSNSNNGNAGNGAGAGPSGNAGTSLAGNAGNAATAGGAGNAANAGTTGSAGLAGSAGSSGSSSAGSTTGGTGGFQVGDVIGPENNPDCGPGCRLAINWPIDHPDFWHHGYDTESVVDYNKGLLMRSAVGSTETTVVYVAASGKSTTSPYLRGDWVMFSEYKYPSGEVTMLNLVTNEKKIFFHYDQEGSGDYGSLQYAFNDQYAFWVDSPGGLIRADRPTGDLHKLIPDDLVCDWYCAIDTGYICSLRYGQVIHIDQLTSEVTVLNDGGQMQTDGSCSPDHSQVVWIDYRDPPGPGSNGDYASGGEVYSYSVATKEVTRLTFDSPGFPRGKRRPAIEGNRVVWSEMCPTCEPNPERYDELLGSANRLVYLNLTTGKKCRLPDTGSSAKSIRNNHLFATWWDWGTNARYLADYDLDSPDIPWECE